MSAYRFVILAFCVGLGATSAGSAELYVAPDGADASPGSRGKPFATFERARQEVRRAKAKTGGGAEPVTVWVRGGDYIRTNAFELTALDSGSPTAPVTWRAYKDEKPRLLGGRRLSDGHRVTDPEVLARLPESARQHVLQFDLEAIPKEDMAEMRSRGFARPTTPAHPELFYGGKPMTVARWPNEGEWEHIAGFPEATTQNDGHGGKIGRLEDGFYYGSERPRAWKQTGAIWVHGYWCWDWANSYERVATLDTEHKLIKTAPPYGQYGFRKGQRIYFLNVLEELDQPGEWFLDREKYRLYFWPPAVQAVATGAHTRLQDNGSRDYLLSLLGEPLLKLTGASNVTFRGFTFEATRGNAIEIHGGSSNLVAGCTIRNIGDWGAKVHGGSGHGIIGCDIFDTGDGGVSLDGGDRKTLQPGGSYVENCHLARQGRWSKCYVPAVLMGGVGMQASHNLIHDHPHCAILFNGNDHLIDFNEIHHIALETGDVGAIYTGRDYTYRGNRIRHNYIHDTGGVGMGSMGVYMDDCVSGTEIFANVFYKVHRAAFLGGGRDHQVINNIFVECDHAVELDGRGLDGSPVWHEMVDRTMRDRLKEVPLGLYRERYPAMKTLDTWYGEPNGPPIEGSNFKGVPPQGNVVARNVCVGKWLKVYWHAGPEMLKLENNLTNALSSFVRPPGERARPADFSLRPDSPAWKMGFENIPLEEIGLRKDQFRPAGRWQ